MPKGDDVVSFAMNDGIRSDHPSNFFIVLAWGGSREERGKNTEIGRSKELGGGQNFQLYGIVPCFRAVSMPAKAPGERPKAMV